MISAAIAPIYLLGFLGKYFDPVADSFRVKPPIRKMVNLSRDDLTSTRTSSPMESVFGEFDIILCRNVLIYFNKELQNQIMNKFLRSLAPGGYLVLGISEPLGNEVEHQFSVVNRKNRIYKKRMM